MAVPAQVQARADKADELLKQVQASTENPAGEVPAAAGQWFRGYRGRHGDEYPAA